MREPTYPGKRTHAVSDGAKPEGKRRKTSEASLAHIEEGDPEHAARAARRVRFEGWFDGTSDEATSPEAERTRAVAQPPLPPTDGASLIPRQNHTPAASYSSLARDAEYADGARHLGQAGGAPGSVVTTAAVLEHPQDDAGGRATPAVRRPTSPLGRADEARGAAREPAAPPTARRSLRVASAPATIRRSATAAEAQTARATGIAKAWADERAQWAGERADTLTVFQAMKDASRWSEVARADGSRDVFFEGEHRLTVAPSPIAGMGGFAARPYEKDELILVLAGDACEKERRVTSQHVFRSGSTFTDAANHWSGAINGSGQNAIANAEWRKSGGIFARVGIAKGAEVIISYGPAFWATHGRKAAPRSPPIVSAGGHSMLGLTAIKLERVDPVAKPDTAPVFTGAVSAGHADADDLPLLGLPPRFEREYSLDSLPPGFEWPRWTHIAFHEHSGEMREAWAQAGIPACSVADRRSVLRPSAGCAHFIGGVREFVDMYPHPIQFQSSHVTCGASNWASWETWRAKVLDGSMLRAAEELLWVLSLGAQAAAEQPPTALEILIGPPSFRTNGHEHGSHSKNYLFWLRGLPSVGPSAVVPPKQRVNLIGAAAGTPEQRMLRRSATPRPLALALVEAWRGCTQPTSAPSRAQATTGGYTPWPAEVRESAARTDPTGTVGRLMDEHPESAGVGIKVSPEGVVTGLLGGAEDVWRPEAPQRRANAPCEQLQGWRADMHHNYGLFASQFAPRLTMRWLTFTGRMARALVLVPVAAGPDGPAVMVPLDPAAAGFGEVRVERIQAEAQAAKAARFLSIGIPEHFACHARNGPRDVIVAVPWDVAPRAVIRSAAALAAAREKGALSAWCTLDAIAGDEERYMHAILALQRMRDMSTPGPDSRLDLGSPHGARPIIAHRTAFEWNNATLAGGSAAASSEWAAFVARDKQHGADLRAELTRRDAGDGKLVQMAERVRTASDYLSELVPPTQGLPKFDDPLLRLWPYPERPPPLCTQWLSRLPPQQLPPGCPKRVLWSQLVASFGRRMICDAINGTMRHNLELYDQGASELRQPKFLCLGEGAACRFEHADGLGSYSAWDVLWEREADDSDYYVPLDFERGGDHKPVEVIRRILGDISDQELISFLAQGARYKLPNAPREIRIAHNLKSIETRIRQVSEAFGKLVEAGLYTAVRLCARGEALLPEADRSPLLYIPQYAVGVGGEDKASNPSECRVVGDMGCPHDKAGEEPERARNRPHGPPDGDVVICLNDMMGPKGGPKADYAGPPLPFPDPEAKPRPRYKYQAAAVLRHIAQLAGLPLLGFKADIRHFFFQIWTANEQVWLCVFYAWVLLGDPDGVKRIYFCAIRVSVVVMGARAASKICCRFAEEWLDAWRLRMDGWVGTDWLPRQSAELKEALAERQEALGVSQARPYWAAVYTDDFDFMLIGPEMLAQGALEFGAMNTEANLWMSDKDFRSRDGHRFHRRSIYPQRGLRLSHRSKAGTGGR